MKDITIMTRNTLTAEQLQKVTHTITGWLNTARRDVENWTSSTYEPPAQAQVDAFETALQTLVTHSQMSSTPALDESTFLAAITVLESHKDTPTDLSGDYPTPEGEVYEEHCQEMEVAAFDRVISFLQGENVTEP